MTAEEKLASEKNLIKLRLQMKEIKSLAKDLAFHGIWKIDSLLFNLKKDCYKKDPFTNELIKIKHMTLDVKKVTDSILRKINKELKGRVKDNA